MTGGAVSVRSSDGTSQAPAATSKAAPTSTQGNREGCGTTASVAGSALGASSSTSPPSARSMRMRASPMSRSRLRGSFSRQRRSRRCSIGGVVAGTAFQSGSSLSTAASVSETVSPGNASVPVSISNSTPPKAQMSARLSTAWPRACSGAM